MRHLTKRLMVVSLVLSLVISCNDNNPTEPGEDTTNGNGAINSISGKLDNWINQDGYRIKLVVYNDEKDFFVAGESSISASGNFNISSLNPVPENFLVPISHFFPIDSLSITNPDANLSLEASYFRVYYGSDDLVGDAMYIYFEDGYSKYKEGYFLYSDSDVNVSGSYIQYSKWTIDIHLKKGWNLIYLIANSVNNHYELTFTSEEQDSLSWHYEDTTPPFLY